MGKNTSSSAASLQNKYILARQSTHSKCPQQIRLKCHYARKKTVIFLHEDGMIYQFQQEKLLDLNLCSITEASHYLKITIIFAYGKTTQ